MSTGTNKERLEQNNAKIEELIALVKTKGAIPSKLPQVIDRSITELTAEDFGDIIGIGRDAFSGCKELISVDIPNTITKIGDSAFSSCEKITEITIPSSVTVLEQSAFASCKALENVIIEEPSSIEIIPRSCFSYSGVKNINIPNSLKEFGPYAFSYAELASINIPANVTTIGNYCFQSCDLISVNIPASVTTISSNSFSSNSSLTMVVYEGQAPNIQSNTFSSCNKVTLYDFSNCTSVPTLANVNALGHASGCVIRIPASLYDEWTTATNWSALTDVVWEKVGGAELISFTVNDYYNTSGGDIKTYQAEKGMTFEQWINSEYNTDNYIIISINCIGLSDAIGLHNATDNYTNVVISDTIVAGHEYMLAYNV